MLKWAAQQAETLYVTEGRRSIVKQTSESWIRGSKQARSTMYNCSWQRGKVGHKLHQASSESGVPVGEYWVSG